MNLLSYMKLFGVAIAITFLGACYLYYKSTQATIQQYQENVAALNMAVAESEATVEHLTASIQQMQETLVNVQNQFTESQQNVLALQDKLSKHDLGMLAKKKPKMVEKRVNAGTEDINRCFEIITGSPLTKQEKQATKKSEINTACPDIANPNYHEN